MYIHIPTVIFTAAVCNKKENKLKSPIKGDWEKNTEGYTTLSKSGIAHYVFT